MNSIWDHNRQELFKRLNGGRQVKVESNATRGDRRKSQIYRWIQRAGALLVGALLVSFPLSTAWAQSAPDLGTAEDFGVLGAAAVTNTGPTTVTGDLGVSPGTSITGFPPGTVVPPGTFHAADAVAAQAQADALVAYNDLAGEACDFDLTGQDLDGMTLTPGVYCFDSSAFLATNGTLTLDAQGDPDAVFIFQMGSTLITGSNSTVELINAGQNCNIFWQVGSSATLGTNSVFLGTIIAQAAVTANTSTAIFGRLIALVEAVTLDSNIIDAAYCLEAVEQADLAVEKAVDDANPQVDDTLTFTITTTNLGLADATGVEIFDALPSGLTFASATTGQGSYDETTGIWDIGNLDAGQSATLSIEATYEPDEPGADLVNTALVENLDQEDPDSTNDQSSVVINPPDEQDLADLAIDKNANLDNAPLGSLVTFEVRVRNLGPDTATDVVVDDQSTAGLLFVSSTQSQGTYDAGAGSWDVGSLASGDEASIFMTFQVVGTGTQTNSSSVSGNELDVFPGNNEDSDDVVGTDVDVSADLGLDKSVDDAEPELGDTIIYTLSITNDGPLDATGVEVADGLPASVEYVSDTSAATGTTYDPATGIWSIGPLDAGETLELEISAEVVDVSAPIINTAQITASNQVDDDLTNNQSTVILNPVEPIADLAVQKRVDQPAPQVGDDVIFTITVRNNGPDEATNVELLDVLAPELVYISQNASQGTYDPATGVWMVGDLAAGETPTLALTAEVLDASGPIVNTAAVDQSDQADVDETNNESTVILLPEQPVVDIIVDKSVDPSTAQCGDTVTFTITVRNASTLFGANNVVVQDALDPAFGYISSVATRGTYDPSAGEWSISALGPGEVATLTIDAEILCCS